MSFVSFTFLGGFLFLVLIYFICPVKLRWLTLLIASIIFYCVSGIEYLPFILLTAFISYMTALLVDKNYRKLDEALSKIQDKDEIKQLKVKSKKKCKKLIIAAMVLIIGYLCYTKFAQKIINLFVMSFDSSLASGLSALTIIIPLGISYYTFSTVGYVLDIYWKRYPAEKNFLKYLLYVMYFPHILQGPIARYNRLGTQLCAEHHFDYKRVCFGAQLMIWGFFQKLVIADRLSIFVGAVYDDCENQPGSALLIATLFFAVQIYTDFAGCVNMARGMSQIFGIELEDNFRQPYFSTSVEEFWRRWHITLGAWFRDYLCMPVSVSAPVKKWSKAARKKWGNEAGKNVTTISALVVVWICTGLWHGTGLNYVIWGIWQGGIIILSVLMKDTFVKMKGYFHIDDESRDWRRFQLIRTFILTGIIPRVITRAPDLYAAADIFRSMFTRFDIWVLFNGSLYDYGLARPDFWLGVISIAVLFYISLLKERGVSIRETIAEKNIVIRWSIYLLAIMSVLIFGKYGSGYDAKSFVYMGF